MSAPTTTPTAVPWQWPADVAAFAKEQKVDQYLDAVLKMTWRVFQTAREVKVTVKLDPEIRDQRYLVFEVYVPREDVPNFVEAMHRWNNEEDKILPRPRTFFFCLDVNLVS